MTDRIENMIVDNKMTLSEFQARALLSSGQGPKIFKRNRVFRPETVVYFDQNVFSDLNDDEIAFCKKNRKTKFAYSPAHAEEIFRMQQSEKKDRIIRIISHLTNGLSIQPKRIKEPMKFFKEELSYVIDRCKSDRDATGAVEQVKIANIDSNKNPDLERVKEVNSRTSNVLMDLTDEEFSKLIKESKSHSPSPRKEDFSKFRDFGSINHCFYTLHNILDVMNFKVDRGERAKRSALYDIEHSKYASACDIFVTEDKRLLSRAKIIFEFMKIKTRVGTKEQFFSGAM